MENVANTEKSLCYCPLGGIIIIIIITCFMRY